MMFTCDMCGLCCRNLQLSPLYSELHDGIGICKYLSGNLCSIYNERPLLCRVDESYEKYFRNELSKEEYYMLNHESCDLLKSKNRMEE